MSKSVNEAYQLLENMALNNCQWPCKRVAPMKPIKVHELDVFNNLVVQVSLLTKKLKFTQLQNAQAATNVIQTCPPSCDF